MNILVFFTDNAIPKTGLSPMIDIWELDGTHTINNQPMTEIAGGFYKYDFSTYDASVDYVIRADSVTLLGPERYSYSSNEHKTELAEIQGLVQSNFRIKDCVHDNNGNLTSATVRIYATKADAVADTSHLHEYTITSTVDAYGNTNSYLSTKE